MIAINEFNWTEKHGVKHFLYPWLENGLTVLVIYEGKYHNCSDWIVVEAFDEITGKYTRAKTGNYTYGSSKDLTKEKTDSIYNSLS